MQSLRCSPRRRLLRVKESSNATRFRTISTARSTIRTGWADGPPPGVTLVLQASLALARSSFLMSQPCTPTARTRVVRDAVYKILDQGFICHVGFTVENQPYVIPTSYGRSGDSLYLHGSAASRMLRNLDQGTAVCVTVTLLDGLVLARSIFNHSMNYRSVVILGTAFAVEDPIEKLQALRALSEHILPERWDEVRQPNEQELKATMIVRLPIKEFSA